MVETKEQKRIKQNKILKCECGATHTYAHTKRHKNSNLHKKRMKAKPETKPEAKPKAKPKPLTKKKKPNTQYITFEKQPITKEQIT